MHQKLQNLNKLRELFLKNSLDGYLISTRDEYQSEYIAPYAKRLKYICGFSGSNGNLFILKETIILITDGRYLLQAEKQLNQIKNYIVIDQNNIKPKTLQNIIKKRKIGYDPKLFTSKLKNQFPDIVFEELNDNLIDLIWQDQPTKPDSKIFHYKIKYSGLACITKLEKCYQELNKYKSNYILITESSSINWLLNIRAKDLENTPILLSYLLVSKNKIYLFTHKAKERFKDFKHPEWNFKIEFINLEEINDFFLNIKGKIIIDSKSCSIFLQKKLSHLQIIDQSNFIIYEKAQKNSIEIKYAKKQHIRDSVAFSNVFAKLHEKIKINKIYETDFVSNISQERKKNKEYLCDSFPTICGFKENSAIIHYQPSKKESKQIKGNGVLLIDTGAQYYGCTTDFTRTFYISTKKGEINNKIRLCYTLVLKGHIAICNSEFPQGTTGSYLDSLARQFLYAKNMNYSHGTGHGVGSFLNVHEGPQNLNQKDQTILREGMIISNEPGYYQNNHFGIRIENLFFIKKSKKKGYLFCEQMTLLPYSYNLIDFSLLISEEKQYLIEYYDKIEKNILSLVNVKARIWLTKEILELRNKVK